MPAPWNEVFLLLISLSNPITPGGPVQMLHPLWATALSHSTGLTLGLTSTVELPLWAKKLEKKLKGKKATALPLKFQTAVRKKIKNKTAVRYQTDLPEVTEWGFSETSDEGGIFSQRPDPTRGRSAALSCPRSCPDPGGVQATPVAGMKYTFCTFSEALRAVRAHSAFPEPCTTFHFPYQS